MNNHSSNGKNLRKGVYLGAHNGADPKDVAQRTGAYLTGLQYGVAPVQFHNHDNVNSVPVNSNTLAGIAVLYGNGAPTMKAPLGTLYVNKTPSSDITRLYINTDGGSTWVFVTTNQHL